MIRANHWVAMAAGLALFGISAGASAAMVAFSPSSGSLGVGGTKSVDVVISGLGAASAQSVGVFDIDVLFDSSLLSLGGVTFGTGLDVLGLGSVQIATDGAPGTVNVFELSLDTPADLDLLQPDSFTLFTLLFEGVVPGTSALSLAVNAVGDAEGVGIDVGVSGGELTVTDVSVVPLPAAAWLLLSGLAGLGVLGRRKRH